MRPGKPFSAERRRYAEDYAHRVRLSSANLSVNAKVLAIVGVLACNDIGVISKSVIDSAWSDPVVQMHARNILALVSAEASV